MKYFILMMFFALCIFWSCNKTQSTTTSVLFYNGTWSLPAITASLNSADIITTPLAQGQSSGKTDSAYIQVQAGTNLITIKAGSTTLLDKNIYSMAAAGSSFIIFDTTTVSAPVRFLQLTDDLTIPDTFSIKYRLIDLVPDTSVKTDIWLVNGVTDSVRLDSAHTFIGSTAEASSVQSFSSVKYHGENYTINFRKTGTGDLYFSMPYSFAIQNIYSIIFSGLLTGTGNTGIKLSVLRHHIP